MREYQRAFDQDIADSSLPEITDLLVSLERLALRLLLKGISLFPNNHMILRNYANFHRDYFSDQVFIT